MNANEPCVGFQDNFICIGIKTEEKQQLSVDKHCHKNK